MPSSSKRGKEKKMISVEQARKLLMKNVDVLPPVKIALEQAAGYILAEDVIARHNLPLFDQSAMDGYAIAGKSRNKQWRVIGEIKAGERVSLKLKKGEAARIFTGAKIPEGTERIVLQEHVKIYGNTIHLQRVIPARSANIRFQGTQLRKNETALKKGTLLAPAAIGLLASLGCKKVKVHAPPVVSIIVTGDELQQGNGKLQDGKIYESNSLMLHAALQQQGIITSSIAQSADNLHELKILLKKNIRSSDIVLVSGGISVGKYDFVKVALNDSGVQQIFHKVAQKPGKPLSAGKKNNTLIFALPGNPAASLVCFYEYVLPAIRKMQGNRDYYLSGTKLSIASDIHPSADRALFLKGMISGKKVIALNGQESHMLKSFSEADCLIYIPQKNKKIKKGSKVAIHCLPQ